MTPEQWQRVQDLYHAVRERGLELRGSSRAWNDGVNDDLTV